MAVNDSADTLDELVPMDLFPWAVYAPNSHGYARKEYKRYRTKGGALAAIALLRSNGIETKLFSYDYGEDTWNEVK